MATVTGLTASRMLQIEASSVVSGTVNGSGNLILTRQDGAAITAGKVVGPAGANGQNAQAVMTVEDSSTVDLTLTGAGTVASPWRIKADLTPTATPKNYGTYAERDVLYPMPYLTADQVALANRRVVWFNTEFGWDESFYVPTGTSGLTVPGLRTGATSGWYPIGNGPWINVTGKSQGVSSGNAFTNYNPMGTLGTIRKGTANQIDSLSSTSDGRIVMRLAGMYTLKCSVRYPNGGGTGISSFRLNDASNVEIDIDQRPTVLLQDYGQTHMFDLGIQFVPKNAFVYVWTDAAAWAITVADLTLAYVGPPLT